MLLAQSQTAGLYLDAVAQALAQQATAWKSLLLAHHYKHLQRQTDFPHKEQTTRWYVEHGTTVCEDALGIW
jgi:hypothetical protein